MKKEEEWRWYYWVFKGEVCPWTCNKGRRNGIEKENAQVWDEKARVIFGKAAGIKWPTEAVLIQRMQEQNNQMQQQQQFQQMANFQMMVVQSQQQQQKAMFDFSEKLQNKNKEHLQSA